MFTLSSSSSSSCVVSTLSLIPLSSNSVSLSLSSSSSVSSSSSSTSTHRKWEYSFNPPAGFDLFENPLLPSACTNCEGTEFDEDVRSGDTICIQCATVQSERAVSETAEWRDFEEDTNEGVSHSRVGQSHNTHAIVDLSTMKGKSNSHLSREEKEFLWEGERNIKRLLEGVFLDLLQSNGIPSSIQTSIQMLFQEAFKQQLTQMKTDPNFNPNPSSKTKRQRFSKRKQFVIAFSLHVLKNNHVRITLPELNQIMGWKVSLSSVKKVLKDMNLL